MSKKKKRNVDEWIEYEYEKEVTFECPIRGIITQKIKVKRLKTRLVESKPIINIGDDDKPIMEPYSDEVRYVTDD